MFVQYLLARENSAGETRKHRGKVIQTEDPDKLKTKTQTGLICRHLDGLDVFTCVYASDNFHSIVTVLHALRSTMEEHASSLHISCIGKSGCNKNSHN